MSKLGTAGSCGGFLAGAATGAKVSASVLWWLGPVGYPVAIASSTLVGGFIGAIGGNSLGEAVDSKLNNEN